MAGERSEAATPRRLQELRARGQVVKSNDLNTALGLLGGFLVIQQFGGGGAGRLREFLASNLRDLARADLTEAKLGELGRSSLDVYLVVLGPLLVAIPLIGLVANVGQSGLVLSGRALLPDGQRINPLAGLRRFFAARSLVELLKTAFKAGLIGVVVVRTLLDSVPTLLSLAGPSVPASLAAFAGTTLRLGLTATVALLGLAALDYGYQRWEFRRGAQMTKDELREELRQAEGSPQVRARIRQRQRKLTTGRMMHAVPTATVVVTNPTHLAVALAYDSGRMAAPQVVAKGSGLVAEQIKRIAREHEVPVIENKPLAQALFRTVEIGMTIPVELFQAVAELLAYIYSLRPASQGGVHGDSSA
jgi:flagellar biosynthetic protein FlhB